MLFVVTEDGSVETATGRVLHFSIRRFIDEIARGKNCFICGAEPSSVSFNNEHIIPRWLLRRHRLYNQAVTLPNSQTLTYGQYTVPCCTSCNSLLASQVETPLSRLTRGGYEGVSTCLERDGGWQLFAWLALVFLKTHLKDNSLRWFLDQRKAPTTIGEVYDWRALHHIHCVARSFYAQPELDPAVHGTLILCQAGGFGNSEEFDYGDLYQARTVLLRTGDICLIAVLNDSGSAGQLIRNDLEKITGPLSVIQLRELAARLAMFNLQIRDRPQYYSEPLNDKMAIRATVPRELDTMPASREDFGAVMERWCSDLVRRSNVADAVEVCENIRRGRVSFLFDGEGNFTPPRDQRPGR